MTPETRPTTNPWLPAALSLIIPGGGQFILNHKSRGFVLFLTFFLLLALILWTQAYALLVPLALLLLWIARDAYQLARGSQPGWGTSLLLIGIVLYGAAIKLFVFAALIVRLALPIHTGYAPLDWSIFLAGTVVVAMLIGLVESIMARLRLPSIPNLLVGAGVLSLFSMILVLVKL